MRRLAMCTVVLLVAAACLLAVAPARADAGDVSRDDGIRLLQETRASVDRTLELIKQGRADEAFAEAKSGYLSHFEQVEIPLRIADNELTITTEAAFAEIRSLISERAPVGEIRDRIVELRGLLDSAERRLTDLGVGAPMVVATQAFLILFREGFEIVLLLSMLFGYLEAARSTRFMRPILVGVGLAAFATILTILAMPALFSLLPFNREVLEAVTALVAVALLFYVSFWLVARLEHKRWMEFVRTRMWRAMAVGSGTSLVLVGFTAVYREGFETALFYQSLLSFGSGLGPAIAAGVAAAIVALVAVAYAMFVLGRKLPISTFMNVAVAMVMATSVAFLGNAVNTLQSADVIGYHPLDSWPRLPIFLAEATGYWPTLPSVLAQVILTTIYLLGGLYVFVVKPRLLKRQARPARGGVAVPA